ncbi:30S ribosome-binding factor RbfA [Patescibacteria group bacterium]|nr:30S ribosome-binding factor RbfA [Patescibacteria group bacterium]
MNNRTIKINELIKRELSGIILKQINIPLGSFVTITKVETAADLVKTKIWISIFPDEYNEEILKIFNKNAGKLQDILNKRLSMKWVPRIKFFVDLTNINIDKK